MFKLFTAKRIKITELETVLGRLKNGDFEHDFFGITSNGTDCIYFFREGDFFAIEYEVMKETQIAYLEKLQNFAGNNNYNKLVTTFDNKPEYDTNEPAPVLHIEPKCDVQQTMVIAQKLMTEVFSNNEETKYEVVA